MEEEGNRFKYLVEVHFAVSRVQKAEPSVFHLAAATAPNTY